MSAQKMNLSGHARPDGTFEDTGAWNCELYGEGSGADQAWYIDGTVVGSHSWRCKS